MSREEIKSVYIIAYEFSAVAPVQIITSGLPDGRRGRVYSQSLQASGGSVSYVWSVSTGSLPAGCGSMLPCCHRYDLEQGS